MLGRVIVAGSMLCVSLTAGGGCARGGAESDSLPSDHSYGNHRGRPCGPNALDIPVSLENFEGSFLWVDYAAPWCEPCSRQAAVLRDLEASVDDGVVFLTLICSGEAPHQEATVATARLWAGRHGLDPARVVASGEMGRTIPQHTLFSPSGQTLYHAIGYHSGAQIRATLIRQAEAWRQRHPDVTQANDGAALLSREEPTARPVTNQD